jgi:uncharacterized SAM-binding protein YcdF (DUF218 family)
VYNYFCLSTKRTPFIIHLLLLMLLFQLASCLVSKRSKKAYEKGQHLAPFDAVIVPGVPFKNGRWDTVMKGRVLWSWILYKNGFVKNVIYSGAAVYSPYKEAVIMGLYAQQLGIPQEHIYYDTLAQHSTENVYYSYLLAQKAGFKTIALATDPFQSFMLRGYTKRRFGSPIYHFPFVYDSLSAYNNIEPVIDPHAAKVAPWQSIYKRQGRWKRFRGTLGHDIDWSSYKNGRLDPL